MNNKSILLTICIPTYNRAEILRGNLQHILTQLDTIDTNELEIVVSNNCSTDHTDEVVHTFIDSKMPIVYNHNDINLGSNGNFLKCMHLAHGKYVYLLGDDDYLKEGTIKLILDVLKNKEYGVLCLNTNSTSISGFKEYNNNKEFIKTVSYFYTFMSGFIFRKDIIASINNPERYIPSWLLQMPFYIKSTLQSNCNAIISEPIFANVGIAAKSNGGYNFFDVFVNWYYKIWKEYLDDKQLLKWLKKDIWTFVWQYTKKLLLHKDVGNFKVKNGWIILFKHYGNESYFWRTLFTYIIYFLQRKIKKYYEYITKKNS